MTIEYGGFSNTPCSIIRGAGSNDTQNDTAFRALRVSNYGVPTPVNFFGPNHTGNFDNPVFFKKMLAAALQITGSGNNPALLSNLTIGNVFWFVQPDGPPSIVNAHHATYPNGSLLDFPFFESFAPFDFTSNDKTAHYIGSSSVTFEDTLGERAPRWADINVAIDIGTATDDSGIYMIKLFHSLTT